MADLEKITRKRLGELLVAEGVIGQDQLAEALRLQEQTGELIGEILVKSGFTNETEIAKTLCTQFAKPFMKPSKYDITKPILSLVPPRMMVEQQFMPVDRFGNLLVIAMAGLLDGATIAQLQKMSGCDLEIYITTSSDLKAALRRSFPDLFDPITMAPKFEVTAAVTQGVLRAPLTSVSPDTGEQQAVAVQDMSVTSSEAMGATAEAENDWEALFEEAEQNVMRTLHADEVKEPKKKKG